MEPCDRTREARCSFEKRREYTSVESQQLETGKEWQPFELVSIEGQATRWLLPLPN